MTSVIIRLLNSFFLKYDMIVDYYTADGINFSCQYYATMCFPFVYYGSMGSGLWNKTLNTETFDYMLAIADRRAMHGVIPII